MDLSDVNSRGLVLLGCGKMGSAMLAGWLDAGVTAKAVTVLEPNPSDWLQAQSVGVNTDIPADPAILLIAVKPQMMDDALTRIAGVGSAATVFLSVAAGIPIARFAAVLGDGRKIIRAMPNTPAAVGQGITALIGHASVTEADMALAETLLSAVGETVRLASETDMDAVTAVSGSGPAYVFHLIETLATAGEAEGLSPELALHLARKTVSGAGALAEAADDSPAQLRINVTSPAGTTAAALEVLMDEDTGFSSLLKRAVAAAAARSRELGQ